MLNLTYIHTWQFKNKKTKTKQKNMKNPPRQSGFPAVTCHTLLTNHYPTFNPQQSFT